MKAFVRNLSAVCLLAIGLSAVAHAAELSGVKMPDQLAAGSHNLVLNGLGMRKVLPIRSNDFPVIYGIVLFITIAIAVIMTLLEFIYPLLDPRIRQE